MNPHTHLLSGVFVALLFFKLEFLTLEYASLIVVLTVLIDLDHLVNFVYETKRFSFNLLWKELHNPKYLKKTWFHFKKGRILLVLLLIFILQLNFSLGLVIFIAYFLHVFIDDFSIFLRNKSKQKNNKIYVITELVMDCFFIIAILVLL